MTSKQRTILRRRIASGGIDGYYRWERTRVGRCVACACDERLPSRVSPDLFVGRRIEGTAVRGAILTTGSLCAGHAVVRESRKRGLVTP